MAKPALIAGLVVGLALLAGSCKKRTACENADPCAVGESCVYVHADVGMRCAQVCQADGECPEEQECLPGAATCKTCQDMLRICK